MQLPTIEIIGQIQILTERVETSPTGFTGDFNEQRFVSGSDTWFIDKLLYQG
jgi:hypothetical protein